MKRGRRIVRRALRPQNKRPPASVAKVARLLDRAYPKTRLGNKANPLNELAFIMLSGQTGGDLAQTSYADFKRRFPRWDEVADAPLRSIVASIRGGGLAIQKARYLRDSARLLKTTFGRVTLAPLRQMRTRQAETFLCTLPGVGIKSARCVLLYSLLRAVFPADVHCMRVMTRLGWLQWHGQRGEALAETAQVNIPPSLRNLLHVRFIQHGRAVCRPRPNCPACVLNQCCPAAGNA